MRRGGRAAGLRRQGGFALLLVLWAVALLAILATQITAAGRGEALLARNLRDAAVAEAAADAGVAQAIFHAIDTSAGHWAADGALHVVRLPGATVEVRISGEAGKVNLNTAPPELLAGLIHAVGTDTGRAAALAGAIVDWRFNDVQQQGGAKLDAYRLAGRAYGPPGQPFRSLEELGLVLGMTPELLGRLSPYLTLYHDGAPNAATAPPAVRQALQEAGGGAAPDLSAPDESVVSITARAGGPGGSGFVRACMVAVGQGAGGSLYQVLTWDQVP